MNQDQEEKPNRQKFDFKPLTSGLGFHPFSDGLPYAPVSKRKNWEGLPILGQSVQQKYQDGLGAVSAGKPVFINPSIAPRRSHSNGPRVHVPVVGRGVEAATSSDLRSPVPSAAPHELRAQIFVLEPVYGINYLVKRSFAYCLDLSVNIIFGYVIALLLISFVSFNPDVFFAPESLPITLGAMMGFHWANLLLQEWILKTSVGKRLCGLHLPGKRTKILLRGFTWWISQMVFFLGVLWSLLDRKRRAWHDLISGVQPHEICAQEGGA